MWDIYLQIYRRKAEEGDNRAGLDIIGLVQSELTNLSKIIPQTINNMDTESNSEDDFLSTTTTYTAVQKKDDPNSAAKTNTIDTNISVVQDKVVADTHDDFDFPEFGDLPDLSTTLQDIPFQDIEPLDFDDW